MTLRVDKTAKCVENRASASSLVHRDATYGNLAKPSVN